MTSALRARWPLRMRVRKSARGSVMLMRFSSPRRLPAGLAQARNVAAHRRLAELLPPEAEFSIYAPRATGDRAAIAEPRGRRIAWHRLQLSRGLLALHIRILRIADRYLELRALGRVLLHELFAALLALDHAGLRHLPVLTCGTGS